MNSVALTGRITKDPEMRYTSNGMANLRFTIAVDRSVARDANGNRQADFISCVAFGQQADFISRFARKGNMLAIDGRIQTSQFQGQDGQMRYTTDVVVEHVENLSPRDPMSQPMGAGAPMQQAPQQNMYQGYVNPTYGSQVQQTYNQSVSQTQSQQPKAPESFTVGVSDDDLPF